MVSISSATRSADDLERIEDVGDEAVALRNEVVDRLHAPAKASRAHESANEEPAVGRVVLADGVVDVDLAVLGGAGGEGEVGEAGELELVGESGLDIANGRNLLPDAALLAEGEVGGVLALTADEESEATKAATVELVAEGVDVLGEARAEGLLVDRSSRLGDGEGNVDDVPLGLAVARSGGETSLVGVGDVAERARELVGEVFEVGDREHGAVANRLVLTAREEEGEVRVRRRALRRRAGARRRRGARLGSRLAHPERPRNDRGLALRVVGLDVVDADEAVRLVGATNVGVEGGEGDRGVLVAEEGGEDVEDREARVDNVLEDVLTRGAVDGSGLAVDGLRDRRAENLLELDESLVEGGELAMDEDLARLERNLRRRLGVELGETLEDGAERRLDEGERVALLDDFEEGEDEAVLGSRLVVRQNKLDDRVELLAVGLAKLEDDVVLPSGEHGLRLRVRRHDAGERRPLVLLEARLVALDDVLEGCERRLEGRALSGAEGVEGGVDELAKACGGEFGGGVGLGVVDRGANLRLEVGRKTAGEGREDGVRFAVRKLGVAEDRDELLDGALHDRLVVVTGEDIGEDLLEEGEALVGLVPDDTGEAEGRELAVEGSRVVDAAGVVEGEDSEDVSGLEGDSRLLDELGDSVLGGDERHDHLCAKEKVSKCSNDGGSESATNLHDFDLGVRLTLADVLATLDEVANELSGRRTPELGRVVLLGDEDRPRVDRKTQCSAGNAAVSYAVPRNPAKGDELTRPPPWRSRCNSCRRAGRAILRRQEA